MSFVLEFSDPANSTRIYPCNILIHMTLKNSWARVEPRLIVKENQRCDTNSDGGVVIMSADHFSGQLSDPVVSGLFVQSWYDMQQIYILKRSFCDTGKFKVHLEIKILICKGS